MLARPRQILTRRRGLVGRELLHVVGGDLVDDADPALTARLGEIVTDGRPERLVLIDVEGVDWSCPQHTTPRWSELADALAPPRTRLHELEQENARLRAGVVQC